MTNQVATAGTSASRRVVRVWFGEHVIARQVSEPALARRYEQAMRRRFTSLRVTNDPATTGRREHT